MTGLILRRLPERDEVVRLVIRGVKECLVGHTSYLATLATELLGLDDAKLFVWNWWGFLKEQVVENSSAPLASARAAKYTKARRQMRESGRQSFIMHDGIRNCARELPVGRVDRDLAGVYLAIEEASA